MRWIKASERMAGGISFNEHTRVHRIVIKKCGKANHCENKDCQNPNAKVFNWALKKGKQYSENPEDYMQLCVSCHRKYDFTEEIRQKLKDKKRGELHNQAKLSEIQVRLIHKMLAKGYSNKYLAEVFKVSPTAICDIKRGKRWPHLLPPNPQP